MGQLEIAFEQALEKIEPLFQQRARNLVKIAPKCIEATDLVQEARIAAYRMWSTRDHETGNIEALMTQRGRGAMIDYMYTCRWAPKHDPDPREDFISYSSQGSVDPEEKMLTHDDPENLLIVKETVRLLLKRAKRSVFEYISLTPDTKVKLTATVVDVAREAGVSKTTARVALSDKHEGKCSTDTVQHVHAVAERVGYNRPLEWEFKRVGTVKYTDVLELLVAGKSQNEIAFELKLDPILVSEIFERLEEFCR